ncbi:hypothetical protein GLOTRDRAFT_131021 [Gloeophyllum trabeum ATCC 11539]|uniref:Cell wall galactomannoprotein n=1 Tax=Gloeophyllum trabeum (strain ATCC 11539 / FP-39264 / Madison 617) TaxID=670483 RepID=S7Q159_GLOTA|nr:uncharacterized protein GLOTRDRAFT_131021 [Gloeophyllum trabeum ATCC 11539]EPQ53681.1 hypothetical protein GLOTRDRAFT_131021 [Gloeophyllum trabeum ATCC 11539]
MKAFSLIPLTLAALSSLAGVFAQSSEAVVLSLQAVSKATTSVRGTLSSMSDANVAREGPIIAVSMQSIISNLSDAIGQVDVVDPKPFKGREAEEVLTALTGFVSGQKEFVSTLINKKATFQKAGLTGDIANCLLGLQGVTDAYFGDVISLIPSQRAAATTQKGSIDLSLEAAIMAYA